MNVRTAAIAFFASSSRFAAGSGGRGAGGEGSGAEGFIVGGTAAGAAASEGSGSLLTGGGPLPPAIARTATIPITAPAARIRIIAVLLPSLPARARRRAVPGETTGTREAWGFFFSRPEREEVSEIGSFSIPRSRSRSSAESGASSSSTQASQDT